MCYTFSKKETEDITTHFGQEFYDKLPGNLDLYSDKWGLTITGLIDNFSMNILFLCESKEHGDSVLKISGLLDDGFINECNVLREYKCKKAYRKLLAYDTEKKVMLLERVSPGTALKSEPLLENRLAVFSKLFNGLHIKPENPELYKRRTDAVADWVEFAENKETYNELYPHLVKAVDYCEHISTQYPDEVLLHGDLAFNNILLGSDGTYSIIDPQGMVGTFVYDTGRYMLIECYCAIGDSKDMGNAFDVVCKVIDYFEKSLNIPNEILRKCFYIELVTYECWSKSFWGNYDINNITLAEKVLKNRDGK